MTFFLLCVAALLGVGAVVARKLRYRRQDEHLRQHPPPRVSAQLSLPHGVDAGHAGSREFWRNGNAARTNDDGRAVGIGQVRWVAVFARPEHGGKVQMRVNLTCDEPALLGLLRTARQTWKDSVSIVRTEDPLAVLRATLSPISEDGEDAAEELG